MRLIFRTSNGMTIAILISSLTSVCFNLLVISFISVGGVRAYPNYECTLCPGPTDGNTCENCGNGSLLVGCSAHFDGAMCAFYDPLDCCCCETAVGLVCLKSEGCDWSENIGLTDLGLQAFKINDDRALIPINESPEADEEHVERWKEYMKQNEAFPELKGN